MSAAPRVLLLCGGRSAEHAVSLSSARSVLAASADLHVTPLVIAENGQLLSASASQAALALKEGESSAALADTAAAAGGVGLAAIPSGFDVVFPLLHGPFGEDGRVQGLLDVIGLPYVGSGVLGSAVGMDKLTMKAVFASHGLPQVAYEAVTRHEWRGAASAVSARVARLGFPMFVKPANLGSSIGISRVQRVVDLAPALELAFGHDRRVIVEAAAEGARELEVAVLGNDAPEASPVGEISHSNAFYDYQTKYSDGQAELHIPADLPPSVAEACRAMAVAAFRAVDARGLARVDFFYLPSSGALLLNEINTMPGFTRHSMYPRLWAAAGIGFGDLVRRLVELALEDA